MSGNWSSSLFDMNPVDDCFMACCFPCILAGQTSHRLKDPTMTDFSSFNDDCFMACTGGGWWVAIKRTEIRNRYGIDGDESSDCCTALCCTPCSLMQQEREVKIQQAAQPYPTGYEAQREGMQMPNYAPNRA